MARVHARGPLPRAVWLADVRAHRLLAHQVPLEAGAETVEIVATEFDSDTSPLVRDIGISESLGMGTH